MTHEELLLAMFPPKTREINIHQSIDEALMVMFAMRSMGVGPWARPSLPPAHAALEALVNDAQKLGIYNEQDQSK